MRPRLLLADDHQMFLDGLERLLSAEFDIVGVCGDGEALVEAAERLTPDVIVADLSMPKMNGLEALRRMKEAGTTARVILLTMHADPEYAAEALEQGVSGYVVKHGASAELQRAIREALAGGTYLSPSIAGDVLDTLRSDRARRVSQLTPRQRDVLRLLSRGLSAKQVAHELGISRRTVEFHKYRMMNALDIQTSAELIRFAVEKGIAAP